MRDPAEKLSRHLSYHRRGRQISLKNQQSSAILDLVIESISGVALMASRKRAKSCLDLQQEVADSTLVRNIPESLPFGRLRTQQADCRFQTKSQVSHSASTTLLWYLFLR